MHIANGAAEYRLRPVAIGQENRPFAGSGNGAKTAAILFSLIATCRHNHLEPFLCLRNLLTGTALHAHTHLTELLSGGSKQIRLMQLIHL